VLSELSIIIIIMTRRRLWSVATALHDVHVPLHSATFVSSCMVVPPSPICCIHMSFEDDQQVFASSCLSSGQLSLQWLAELNAVIDLIIMKDGWKFI